jgi:catechol 2,3-dioxygenase-like lactoylglutathione lyase family enzyme
MAPKLNHHIVWCHDKKRSAAFLTEMLGLPPATSWGPFEIVELDNEVSIDFHDVDEATEIQSKHNANLITEDENDAVNGRILDRGLDHCADPGQRGPAAFNPYAGGRGVYFPDPDGHFLEVITRPYGSGEA